MNQQDAGHFNTAFPAGVPASDDPNGFIFQFWAGHRNASIPPNVAPTVTVSSSSASVTLPCPPRTSSESCPTTGTDVQVTAVGSDPDGDVLLYTWTIDGGTKSADAANITWTFAG